MDRGGPYAVKRLSLVNRGCERSKKTFDSGNDFLEGLWCVNQFGFPDEILPLNIFDPVLSERSVKNRSVQGDGRVSVLECFLNRLGKYLPLEIECAGQYPDIVEILHSAIQDTEFHHGLKFLGDRALYGVAF